MTQFAAQSSGFYKLDAPWFVPVELNSFNASLVNNNIILDWTTASELNNQGFEIEQSFDNEKFNQIGFVPGFGTTTEPKSYSYTDQSVSNGKHYYRLKQIDFDGSVTYSEAVEAEVSLPANFALEQNYPNPFNPSTAIKYSFPKISFVQIKVFDVLGNEIETLVNEEKPAGTYELNWNASNLPSGVYFYQLKAGSFFETKKMILMK